jgi:quercetin 2,3-dioxygenase
MRTMKHRSVECNDEGARTVCYVVGSATYNRDYGGLKSTPMDRRTLLTTLAATPVVAACDHTNPTNHGLQTTRTSLNEPIVQSAEALTFPWQTPDPFLFCVHHNDAYPRGNETMGPAVSLAGRDIGSDFGGRDGWSMYHGETVPGFPQHPHRGFETVTVVRRGLVDHSDSMGATARYGHGDVQWLTAGSGIQHAEMFPLVESSRDNPLELFQLWLNLPRVDKMVAPHFKMLWSRGIPRATVRDSQGRESEITVVAGRYGEHTPPSPPPSSWASRPDSDVAIWTLKMAPNAQFTLPAAQAGSNRMLHFFRGSSAQVAERHVTSRHALRLRANAPALIVNGSDEAEFLMLQGRPIGEPVVQHGPFVMNTQTEIRQAFMDYQRTRFGGWRWDGAGPVHARTEGRFAMHADGSIERG